MITNSSFSYFDARTPLLIWSLSSYFFCFAYNYRWLWRFSDETLFSFVLDIFSDTKPTRKNSLRGLNV